MYCRYIAIFPVVHISKASTHIYLCMVVLCADEKIIHPLSIHKHVYCHRASTVFANINGLVRDCSISIANALEILPSYPKRYDIPSKHNADITTSTSLHWVIEVWCKAKLLVQISCKYQINYKCCIYSDMQRWYFRIYCESFSSHWSEICWSNLVLWGRDMH